MESAKTATPSTPRIACISWKTRSEEHTSELQSRLHLVCRLLLEKKKNSVDGPRSRRDDRRLLGASGADAPVRSTIQTQRSQYARSLRQIALRTVRRRYAHCHPPH